MSGWNFADRVRIGELPDMGAFKIDKGSQPEALGQGRFRIYLVTKDGKRHQMTTYESTIGDMIKEGALEGWIEAYTVPNRKDPDKPYTNFRGVKAK